MLSFSETVHINAPPERVWQVTVDVERWSDFVPHFKKIVRRDAGPFGPTSSADITPAGFVASEWKVVDFAGGRSFKWAANMLPGVHVVGGHAVEPEDGGTLMTLTLEAGGPMWLLAGPLLTRTFRNNVKREAEAFRSYCEGNTS